jgi:hypothetical protein
MSTTNALRAAIEFHGPKLALFTAAGRNDLVREALLAAGNLWISVFLPLRFSDYARKLGYHVTAQTQQRKAKGRQPPFVNTGAMAESTGKAHVEATATKGLGKAVIRIPLGHALQPQFLAVFRRLPPWEQVRLARVIHDTLAARLAQAQITTNRASRQRATIVGPRLPPAPSRRSPATPSARAA